MNFIYSQLWGFLPTGFMNEKKSEMENELKFCFRNRNLDLCVIGRCKLFPRKQEKRGSRNWGRGGKTLVTKLLVWIYMNHQHYHKSYPQHHSCFPVTNNNWLFNLLFLAVEYFDGRYFKPNVDAPHVCTQKRQSRHLKKKLTKVQFA